MEIRQERVWGNMNIGPDLCTPCGGTGKTWVVLEYLVDLFNYALTCNLKAQEKSENIWSTTVTDGSIISAGIENRVTIRSDVLYTKGESCPEVSTSLSLAASVHLITRQKCFNDRQVGPKKKKQVFSPNGFSRIPPHTISDAPTQRIIVIPVDPREILRPR